MAYTIRANDIIEVKVFCSLGTQQGINVLHYRAAAIGGLSQTDQQVADLMSTALAVPYKAYLPTVGRFEGVRLQVVGPDPAVVAVISKNGAGVGAIATDPLPTQAAMLAKKNTAQAGRFARGRIYLPFWGESQSGADGKPTAGALTLGVAVFDELFDPATYGAGGNTVDLVAVLSKKPFINSLEILSYTQRLAWATQRRRSLINKGDQIGP